MATDRKAYIKEWRIKNKDKLRAYNEKAKAEGWPYQSQDRTRRRESINAKQRVENMTDEQKQLARERWKTYYENHLGERLAYQAQRRIIHGEQFRADARAYGKAWRAKYNFPERQLKAFATANNLERAEAARLLVEAFSANQCGICARTSDEIVDMGCNTRRGFHIDHINGDNKDYALKNLQLLCWKCNTTKLDLPLCEESRILIKQHTDLYFTKMRATSQDPSTPCVGNEETDHKP